VMLWKTLDGDAVVDMKLAAAAIIDWIEFGDNAEATANIACPLGGDFEEIAGDGDGGLMDNVCGRLETAAARCMILRKPDLTSVTAAVLIVGLYRPMSATLFGVPY